MTTTLFRRTLMYIEIYSNANFMRPIRFMIDTIRQIWSSLLRLQHALAGYLIHAPRAESITANLYSRRAANGTTTSSLHVCLLDYTP